MDSYAERYFDNIKYNLAQLDEVLENLDKKIKNQSEELKRKDVQIGELKHELWEFNHPKTTFAGPILIDGEICEYVPVVRCKDCRWYDKGENVVDSWEYCKLHRHNTEDDGYCHHGERKEEHE